MSSSLLYRLRDVWKDYGSSFRLEIGHLEIPQGEVFVLLGPTGAGKSTLLRLLVGLGAPTSGELHFENHRFDGSALPQAIRRRITMVHQRPLLLTGSVRFNIEYGLRIRGVKHCSKRADEVLDRLRLTRLAPRPAKTLSGGQMQLVSLARALVIDPEVLLLDEPTAHLDPAHVGLVEETVEALHSQRKPTVIWATHNLFQARRVARRVGLLLDGRLVEVAATQTFFEAPADPRAADFVQGRMVY